MTVIAETTVQAETWSKALLIAGRDQIDELCHKHQLAAYWVGDTDGSGHSTALASHLIWESSDV